MATAGGIGIGEAIDDDDLRMPPQQALNVMYALELAHESSRRGFTVEWESAFSF